MQIENLDLKWDHRITDVCKKVIREFLLLDIVYTQS